MNRYIPLILTFMLAALALLAVGMPGKLAAVPNRDAPRVIPLADAPQLQTLYLTPPMTLYLPLVVTMAATPTSYTLPHNLALIERLYPLSETARDKLTEHGFVILGEHQEAYLSEAYIKAAEDADLGVVVTTDAVLHLFHSAFNGLLATVERGVLYTETLTLVQALQVDSDALYAALPPTQTLGLAAARHNRVVLATARALLEPDFAPPADIVTDVLTYTGKIYAHTAVELYPGDDYTQYAPRGHYAGDPQLERYFRAMKWLGRRIYRLQDDLQPAQTDIELVAAAQLVHLLQHNPDAQRAWEHVYDLTRLLAGPADSITPLLVGEALTRTFGLSFTLDLLEDHANLDRLRAELLDNPRYPTSEIIPVPTAYPGQIGDKYIQIMGERYVPDGEVFQKTVFPHTARTLPTGLDVMAALLASPRADALLAEAQAQDPAYAAQLAALRAHFGGYTITWWTRSTYNSWLYSLQPLVTPTTVISSAASNLPYLGVVPRFIQSEAWEHKSLNTALASWAQLRHDFILYAKQSSPPLGGVSGAGWIEPATDVYRRLADTCRMTTATLANYDALPPEYAQVFDQLAAQLDFFAACADKILAGEALSAGEQDELHGFGRWIEAVFANEIETRPFTIADVATAPQTTLVLHVASGPLNPLVVIYETPEGTPRAGLGYVLSYYEFALPGYTRMTDAEWETQVVSGTLPARPWWITGVIN